MPPDGVQRMTLLLGMSLNNRHCRSANQTGPSVQPNPSPRHTSGALGSTKPLKRASWTA